MDKNNLEAIFLHFKWSHKIDQFLVELPSSNAPKRRVPKWRELPRCERFSLRIEQLKFSYLRSERCAHRTCEQENACSSLKCAQSSLTTFGWKFVISIRRKCIEQGQTLFSKFKNCFNLHQNGNEHHSADSKERLLRNPDRLVGVSMLAIFLIEILSPEIQV